MKFYRMGSDKWYDNMYFCLNDKWYCHSRVYKRITSAGVLNIQRYFIPVNISNSRRAIIEDFCIRKVFNL